MKRIAIAFLCLFMIGCAPVENQARDSAAAIKGAIESAQTKYGATCRENSGQQVCDVVNKGVSAQNALITATEAYCGWSTVSPPSDPNAKCVPVSGAKASLEAAIANANEITKELKGAL
jgi:hypothetical protein